ncbi:MAG TPA: helicase-related protein, partial [Chloroflexota bacterium]|nr:helicase-related protein [Chloroflexota bacterium]
LPYLVQRRRADLERWLGSTTPFPTREASEQTYTLSPAYTSLYQDVLDYCRETVRDPAGLGRQQQRVRHWAAIAMLRCLLSSPAAAVAVLSGRAGRVPVDDPATFESTEELDAVYRPQVLDPLDDERAGDYAPTAPLEDADPHLSGGERRRLATFLRRAETLAGPQADAKLTAAAQEVRRLLAAGCRPIVFCRFIATAKYLAEWLPSLLGQPDVRVAAVTGEMGDEQRSLQVAELARSPRRLLIATDCLSEGVNLQQHFDAVLHYDLPWNPNRLEQREGRVDRFGQPRPRVFTIVLYGANNEVDTVVLDVLIRKARLIRSRLGVSVPVPLEAEQVVQAVVDSVLLRRPGRALQMRLDLDVPQVSVLHRSWDAAAEQERRQRAFFGQYGIQPAEVQRELEAADPVLGDAATVQRFLAGAVQRFNGQLRATATSGVYELVPGDLTETFRTAGETDFPRRVAFDQITDTAALVLGRTHPLVALSCDAILGRALAPEGDARFPRCGAIFTRAVQRRTIVALLRLRYLLRERAETFAEEVVLAAAERR